MQFSVQECRLDSPTVTSQSIVGVHVCSSRFRTMQFAQCEHATQPSSFPCLQSSTPHSSMVPPPSPLTHLCSCLFSSTNTRFNNSRQTPAAVTTFGTCLPHIPSPPRPANHSVSLIQRSKSSEGQVVIEWVSRAGVARGRGRWHLKAVGVCCGRNSPPEREQRKPKTAPEKISDFILINLRF